jgi:carbamoyl-phosphate synthase large subunit
VVARPVNISGTEYEITCVSVGNPHAVTFVPSVDVLDLEVIGPQFEFDAIFPERVNAEFIEIVGKNRLKMRVWERGSGETQACGTGACASAVAAVLNGFCDMGVDIKVKLLGGEITINYNGETIYMTGDAVKVYEGVVEV